MKFFASLFFLISFNAVVGQNDTAFKPFSQIIPGSSYSYSFQPIIGGTFKMGSPATEKGHTKTEGLQKTVTVSPFWIGVYEVTHDQFGVFYKDEQVSQGSKTDAVTRPTAQYIDLSWNMGKDGGFPVNSMSQDGAMMFCRWLYAKTGIFYRLPTEAEWEYACRAGTKTAYFFGNDAKLLPQYGWFLANSKNKYQKVGTKKPNPWGLYDMLGNVSEWVLDQYVPNYFDSIGSIDPVITPSSRYPKSIRGGSYLDNPITMRSAARSYSEPQLNKRDPQMPKSRWWLTDGMNIGFRMVRPLKQPTKTEADAFYAKYLGN
jgi:formylglycine-generating enzyme required for sulfatase activity